MPVTLERSPDPTQPVLMSPRPFQVSGHWARPSIGVEGASEATNVSPAPLLEPGRLAKQATSSADAPSRSLTCFSFFSGLQAPRLS